MTEHPLRPAKGFADRDSLFAALATARPTSGSLPERRAFLDNAAAIFAPEIKTEVKALSLGGRPAERHTPDGQIIGRMLYLHGGGFTVGSPASIRHIASLLSTESQLESWALDYRLAPENPFPAAWGDAIAAFDALPDDLPVLVCGDSAGGNLAVAVARERPGRISGLALLSPWLDLRCGRPSFDAKRATDPLLDGDSLKAQATMYARGVPLHDARISPGCTPISHLPETLLQIGDGEMFLDEATDFAKTHPSVTLDVWADMFHGWHMFWPVFALGRDALLRAAAFLRQRALKATAR